jgi:hypothetical protein
MPVPVVVTAEACEPAPIISEFAVNAAALVTHVAQAMVPVDVIVPPVIGLVVAMLVTVPVVGVVHVIDAATPPCEVST